MPELEKHLPVLHDPLHPYHWEYDNLPLQSLIERDRVINDAVDINSAILRGTAGTQGTLANRLNQSLDQDGSLLSEAVDDSLHNIGYHEDGQGPDLENYVRMKLDERNKLALIADEASSLTISVETPSVIVPFENEPVVLEPSSSVTWEVTGGNKIKAILGFPIESAHRHYYDLEPITSDFINYTVTPTSTPYIEDTLRVFINGIRLSSETEVYVPSSNPTDPWTLIKHTPDHDAGSFVLSSAITSDDVIRVDFDIALT